MSVKDLYRAFVEGKRVKGKIILLGFIEGVLSAVSFKKIKQDKLCVVERLKMIIVTVTRRSWRKIYLK